MKVLGNRELGYVGHTGRSKVLLKHQRIHWGYYLDPGLEHHDWSFDVGDDTNIEFLLEETVHDFHEHHR